MSTHLINVVKELSDLERVTKNAYSSDYSVYEMNENVLQLTELVLNYDLNKCKNFVIDSTKYLDLECCFLKLGKNISKLLDSFVVFNMYHKKTCMNKHVNKKTQHSIPSRLMIITKRPVNYSLETKGDIFF